MESRENLSLFISLVKELKVCINNGNTGDYQASKIFEISSFVENTSKEIKESEVCAELNQELVSLCGMTLEEVSTISDEILSGFLLLKITDETARKAISEFISRFGDSRFSLVCKSLVAKRQIFTKLSSLVNSECSDDIVTSFLLQIWTKHLKNNSVEDERAIQLFDSMLSSEHSFKVLSRIYKFDNVEDWKQTINLIYSRAALKLNPFCHEFWSWFINSKDFFQNVVKSNYDITQLVYNLLIESSENAQTISEESDTAKTINHLNINEIVLILHNLLTLECTFNKTKQFIEDQKEGANSVFWIDVENHYLEFRTKSPSLLVNNKSRIKKST